MYPEYYEAMMKAYNNPAAMAAYYSQYYNQSTASAPLQYAMDTALAGQGGASPSNSFQFDATVTSDKNADHPRKYDRSPRPRDRSRSRSPEDRYRSRSYRSDGNSRYERDSRDRLSRREHYDKVGENSGDSRDDDHYRTIDQKSPSKDRYSSRSRYER